MQTVIDGPLVPTHRFEELQIVGDFAFEWGEISGEAVLERQLQRNAHLQLSRTAGGKCIGRSGREYPMAEPIKRRMFEALMPLLLLLLSGCATVEESPAQRGARMTIDAFIDSGDFAPARAQLTAAIAAAEASNDHDALGAALTWAGFAHYAQLMTSGATTGYEQPRDVIARALELRRQSRDRRAIAETLIYLGLVEEKLGNESLALQMYEESLDLALAGGYFREESYAQRHIAFIEARRGKLESALARQRRSLALREQIGFHEYLPFSLLAVAALEDRLGERDAALSHYIRASTLAMRSGKRRTRVLVALSLGDFYQAREQMKEARQQFELALEIATEIGNSRDVEAARARLSRM